MVCPSAHAGACAAPRQALEAGPPQGRALLRKMWLAPSQMAQAEMPALQNTSSLGMPSRFAKAPVATITLFVRTCRCTLISVGMLDKHKLAADMYLP